MIEIGDTVRIDYRAMLENGVEFDASYRRGEPLSFTIGLHEVVPGLEQALIGMDEGDSNLIEVPAMQAYGAYDNTLIEHVPVSEFPNADQLPIGNYIEIRTPSGMFRTKVVKIEGGMIEFDHNHELAGKDLLFDVEIIEVKHPSAMDRELHPAGCACGCHEVKAQLCNE